MNTQLLSARLQTVVNYIPNGYRIADIGSDHAYLPCHVVQKGIVPFAVAGEVVDGPYQSAIKQVESVGLTEQISVRLGNGLEVIQPGEVDCITIAGMGGSLIASILDRGKDRLQHIKRLILQPNIGAIAIRKWLLDHGWQLVQEEILIEDGKIYEILIAEQGDPRSIYGEDLDAGLLMGPFLKKAQNKAFKQKWLGEKANWLRILQQLEQAEQTEQNLLKKEELLEKIKIVEEVLKP
jgi:tRNA (adenine22-N1)-methyltransferase